MVREQLGPVWRDCLPSSGQDRPWPLKALSTVPSSPTLPPWVPNFFFPLRTPGTLGVGSLEITGKENPKRAHLFHSLGGVQSALNPERQQSRPSKSKPCPQNLIWQTAHSLHSMEAFLSLAGIFAALDKASSYCPPPGRVKREVQVPSSRQSEHGADVRTGDICCPECMGLRPQGENESYVPAHLTMSSSLPAHWEVSKCLSLLHFPRCPLSNDRATRMNCVCMCAGPGGHQETQRPKRTLVQGTRKPKTPVPSKS